MNKIKNPKQVKKQPTTWEPVEKWYKASVGDEGNYYHRQLVLPGVLKLMNLGEQKQASILDLACGQGVLSRALPKDTKYHGVDISPSLVKEAKQKSTDKHHQFSVADITKPLMVTSEQFSHAAIILALQNLSDPFLALKNAAVALKERGKLVLVLNHPCFRIPRQSSWQVDQDRKIQYRRVDRYATPMPIPIQAHPSKGERSEATISFHYPLSSFVQWLKEAGFLIEQMEEWYSDKVSIGSAAKMENRSRQEFPLFLAISAIKNL